MAVGNFIQIIGTYDAYMEKYRERLLFMKKANEFSKGEYKKYSYQYQAKMVIEDF